MLGRIAMSLLTGSTAGAALMYLLDPETGEKHRKQVKRSARAAYAAARDSAQDAYETASERAQDAWEATREYSGEAWETAKDRASDWSERAGKATTRARRKVARAISPDDVGAGVDGDADVRFAATGADYDEDLYLTPAQSYTAYALARHSRDLHGEARDAYARARDMYYDALVDLDLARARYRREEPKKTTKAIAKVKARGVVKSEGPDYLTISLVAAGCLAAGAAAMYLLDPNAGRRRRAMLKDKTYSVAHRTTEGVSDTVASATRYASNWGQGKVAEAKTAFRQEDVSDEKLEARVRAEIGHVVSHPGAVEVKVKDCAVTLSGPVLASEFDALMKCVYGVPGVREVINQMETHVTAGHVPGLQG